MRDLYSDYLLAMWLNDDSYSINIQSGLVNPNDDGADSFNQFLLTHGIQNVDGITTGAYQKWTQEYNPLNTFAPTMWSLFGAQDQGLY